MSPRENQAQCLPEYKKGAWPIANPPLDYWHSPQPDLLALERNHFHFSRLPKRNFLNGDQDLQQ